MQSKVSIVIPAYNAAEFITRTLDSVKAQTYKNWELVVVDDGSSDNTSEVVNAYLKANNLPGACITQKNKKIAGARNTGIAHANGDLIALLDHDDLWYPEKLETVVKEFIDHPETDLICSRENIVQNGLNQGVTPKGKKTDNLYYTLLIGGNFLSPSATVFRKAKALEIGGFREDEAFNTVEDYDFWMRMAKIAKFTFLDVILGEYLLVERAASRNIDYHYSHTENLLKDHFKTYFGPEPSLKAGVIIRRRLSQVYRGAANQLLKHKENFLLQKQYIVKMLKTWPFEPKNIALAAIWAAMALAGKAAK